MTEGLQGFFDGFGIAAEQSRPLAMALAQRYTRPEQGRIQAAFTKLSESGLLESNDPQQILPRFLTAWDAHTRRRATPPAQAIQLLEDTVEAILPHLPRKNQLSYFLKGNTWSQGTLEEVSCIKARENYGELVLFAFQVADTQPLALPQAMAQVLEPVKSLQTYLREKPDVQSSIGLTRLRHAPDLATYQTLMERYPKELNRQDRNFALRDALHELFKRPVSAARLEQTLALLDKYEKAGGKAEVLASLLIAPEVQIETLSPEAFNREFQAFPSMMARYPESKEQQVFDCVLKSLWRFRPPHVQLPYAQLVEMMTQVALHAPQCMEMEDRVQLSGALLKHLPHTPDVNQHLTQTLTQLKHLFEGIGPDLQVLTPVLEMLHKTGDPLRAGLAKDMMLILRPHVAQNASVSYQALIETLHGTQQEASTPPPDWATALTQLQTVLDQRSPVAPATPQLGEIMLKILSWVEKGFCPPEDTGATLTTLSAIAENLPPSTTNRLLGWASTQFENTDLSPQEGLTRLKILQKAIAQYHTGLLKRTPNGVADPALIQQWYQPFLYIVKELLPQVPTETWSTYLNDLGNAFDLLRLIDLDHVGQRDDTLAPVLRSVFEAISNSPHGNPGYPGGFAALLQDALAIRHKVSEHHRDCDIPALLRSLILGSPDPAALQENFEALRTLLYPAFSAEEKQQALQRFLAYLYPQPEQEDTRDFLAPLANAYLAAGGNTKELTQTLTLLASESLLTELPAPLQRDLARLALAPPSSDPNALSFMDFIHRLQPLFYGDKRFHRAVLTLLPSTNGDFATLLNELSYLGSAMYEQRSDYPIFPKNSMADRLAVFEEIAQLFVLFHEPTRFLNAVMVNPAPRTLDALALIFQYVEYGNRELGKQALPELMALLKPYVANVQKDIPHAITSEGETLQSRYINKASQAITSLYSYLGAAGGIATISQIDRQAFNNWSRIGTLGLSFSKWQYDSMRRWKGGGPAEKPPLMIASGQFQPLSSRETDAQYGGGFWFQDSKSGLTVEMRRAYIVISKPEVGTLVIRNSSPVFGRTLLEEPAYFDPSLKLSGLDRLLDPDRDLHSPRCHSVLSKALNRDGDTQQKNQTLIQTLLDDFDTVIADYTGWKCNFTDGRPPAGFKDLLESALMSARYQGIHSPFGRKKNLKLAWVNPYGLPLPVRSLATEAANVQEEMAFYHDVLSGRRQVANIQEYQDKMPTLLAFISEGLKHHLELILTE